MYEKIAALIARNDLVSAEKLLKSQGAALTAEQRKQLQALAAQRARSREAEARRQTARRNRRQSGHRPTAQGLKKVLFISWLAAAALAAPYAGMCHFHFLALRNGTPSRFRRSLGMEVLILLDWLLAALFFGVGFGENRQKRRDIQRRRARVKPGDGETAHSLCTLEGFYAQKERDWLIGLACAVGLMLVDLIDFLKLID